MGAAQPSWGQVFLAGFSYIVGVDGVESTGEAREGRISVCFHLKAQEGRASVNFQVKAQSALIR